VTNKKRGSQAGSHTRKAEGFNPETSRYYFPAMALIFLLGIIILFSSFIFSDQMLYGNDTINAGLFFRSFYVDYVNTHGSIPVWNPYVFGGMPFVDAFHGDIFYPLSILKFFGNIFRMLIYNYLIHIFLAGIFMYFTARQFRLSRMASTLSGTAYMFAAQIVSLIAAGHDGKIFVATLFPLTILFLDRAFEKKPLLNFSLLGLVIGLIILTPHAQLSYYALWAIAFYGVFKLIILYRAGHKISGLVKPGGMLAGAVAIGLLISAIQFYPGYIYTTKYSPRADSKRGWDWAISWSMHEQEAVSLVVPEFSGSTGVEESYYWGKNVFKDNSEYTGMIPLFLAIIAVFWGRRKEAIFFGGLSVFALIYALGATTPVFRIFYYLIPNVKSLRAPSTIMFLFLFSASLLAGMGLQYIIDKGRSLPEASKKKLMRYLIGVPSGLLIFAFLFAAGGETMLSLFSFLFDSEVKTTMAGNVSKWQMAMMNLPLIKSGFWIAFLFVAASATAVWLFLSRKAGIVILMAIPLLAMVDGIRFSSRFIKTYDYRQQFTPNVLTDYFKSLPGKYRVYNMDVLRADYLPFFGIEMVTGYHGNQLRWYDDLLGGPTLTNLNNPNFLNLVGARYLVAAANARLPLDYFGPQPLTVDRNFGNINIYKNGNAFPRAFIVNQYEVIPDRKNIYPQVISGTKNLRRVVYLEENPPIAITPGDTLSAIAEISSYANDSVVIDVQSPANSILVLTDNYYVAWDAYADGIKTPILRADGSFRAVPIKAGTKRVIFKYNRSMNNTAKTITLATLLLVGVIMAGHGWKYYKEKKTVSAIL
jgi:hypothetical protein